MGIIDQQWDGAILMKRTSPFWWYTYPPEKYEGKSVGMMKFPTEWNTKKMFQTTNHPVSKHLRVPMWSSSTTMRI